MLAPLRFHDLAHPWFLKNLGPFLGLQLHRSLRMSSSSLEELSHDPPVAAEDGDTWKLFKKVLRPVLTAPFEYPLLHEYVRASHVFKYGKAPNSIDEEAQPVDLNEALQELRMTRLFPVIDSDATSDLPHMDGDPAAQEYFSMWLQLLRESGYRPQKKLVRLVQFISETCYGARYCFDNDNLETVIVLTLCWKGHWVQLKAVDDMRAGVAGVD